MKVTIESGRLSMLEDAEAAWRHLGWVLIECGICSLKWEKPAGYSKFTAEARAAAFVRYLADNWQAVDKHIQSLPKARLVATPRTDGKVCNISGPRPAPVKRVKEGAA